MGKSTAVRSQPPSGRTANAQVRDADLKIISTRVPRTLHRDVKVAVVEDGYGSGGVMRFIREALEEKLKRRKAVR